MTGNAPSFDLDDLRARTDDDDLAYELLESFVARVGPDLDALKNAAGTRRFNEISRLAHRIRGPLYALGADEAVKTATELELHATTAARGALTEDATIERALTALSSYVIRTESDARAAIRRLPRAAGRT